VIPSIRILTKHHPVLKTDNGGICKNYRESDVGGTWMSAGGSIAGIDWTGISRMTFSQLL